MLMWIGLYIFFCLLNILELFRIALIACKRLLEKYSLDELSKCKVKVPFLKVTMYRVSLFMPVVHIVLWITMMLNADKIIEQSIKDFESYMNKTN